MRNRNRAHGWRCPIGAGVVALTTAGWNEWEAGDEYTWNKKKWSPDDHNTDSILAPSPSRCQKLHP